MSSYTTTIVRINGDRELLETTCSAINSANEQLPPGVEYDEENYALNILNKLHVNTRRLPVWGCWWSDAKITKRGHLVFTDYSWGKCNHLPEALKKNFANLTIAYTFVSYY